MKDVNMFKYQFIIHIYIYIHTPIYLNILCFYNDNYLFNGQFNYTNSFLNIKIEKKIIFFDF